MITKCIGKFIISKFEYPKWIEILYLYKNNTIGNIEISCILKIPLEFSSLKQLFNKNLDSNSLRFINNMSGGR